MKIEAKALLLDHAAEALDDVAVSTPSKPCPPPQVWQHRELVERSIRGDFEPARHRPGLAGFLAAWAQSHDWGTPVRSSAAGWVAHAEGNGAIGTAGFAKAPDAMTAREEYARATRAMEGVVRGLVVVVVASGASFDPHAQMRLWMEVHGPGVLEWRTIKGGPERKVKGMGTVAASPVVRIPERHKHDATEVSEQLGRRAIVVTPHEIGMMCRRVSRLVRAALIAANCLDEKAARAEPKAAWDPGRRLREGKGE